METPWSPRLRPLTIGLLIVATAWAFESLAVATILPEAATELGGLSLYGWAFSAFLLANLVTVSIAGSEVDRIGPLIPFALGIGFFILGLALAAIAPTMPLLVGARTVQGIGAGMLSAVSFAVIGGSYPDSARPRMLALMSTAWVIPGLGGPAIAGIVGELVGWRWVFAGVIPFPLIAAALAGPALRALPQGSGGAPDRSRFIGAALLAAGLGLLLAGLTQEQLALLAPISLVGLVLLAVALPRVLTPEALRMAPGGRSVLRCRGAAMLRIEKLTKTYRTGDRALNAVDLVVPSGQVVALIGPSGAGKSTLIRCVNRLVEPSSGKVSLDGEDITALGSAGLRKARRQMGMIFQEYALVERLTVMENVLSGRLGYVGFWRSLLRKFPQADVDEAFRLLDRVGLIDMIDKRADELSGGQRQRVGIARALIQNPRLLLVDEPTASLDPKTSRQIMRLICELCAERDLAAVINIHDVALAQMFVERIVGLKAGELAFDGKPTDMTEAVLTSIYGEEDWQATIRNVDEEEAEAEAAAL